MKSNYYERREERIEERIAELEARAGDCNACLDWTLQRANHISGLR